MHRLDLRNPLVLDTHELGRRPGASEVVERTVPAPPDLAVEVIGVPQGSDLGLHVRLESVVEGILVSGQVDVVATGECARCLDPLERALTVDLQDLYAYPGHGDEDTRSVVDDGLVDLEPAIRDAVVLALPLAPVCRPDCPGLCSSCGARLADEPGHAHETVDPRWAALAALGPDGDPADHEPDRHDPDELSADGRTIDDRTPHRTEHEEI